MIRVLIADDQDLVRAGFRMILDAQPDIQVVGEAADGAVAVDLARTKQPDVVLMDLRMPGMDGLQATQRLATAPEPRPHVLVLTTFDTDQHVYAALRAGAAGFMLKTVSPTRLVEGIRLVADGEALLAPTITRRLIEEYVRRPLERAERPPVLNDLTARELEVFTLIGRGKSNQQIAERLVVSSATVKTHVNRVFAKLGVRARVHAVVLAYETGVVRPGEPDPDE